LKRPIVVFAIADYDRAQFLTVPCLKDCRVERHHLREICHVFAIDWTISSKLRQRQVVSLEFEESEIPKMTGMGSCKPRGVRFRVAGYSDVLEAELMLLGQR